MVVTPAVALTGDLGVSTPAAGIQETRCDT